MVGRHLSTTCIQPWGSTKVLQGKYWWTLHMPAKFQGHRSSLASMTKHQNNSAFKEIGLLKTWSIHHHEIDKCCGFLAQTFRFHENSSYISCFFVGTIFHASTIPKRGHEHPHYHRCQCHGVYSFECSPMIYNELVTNS